MSQLALLKRSDANLVLVACCDRMEQAMALAAELSKMQAFSVAALALLPTLGPFREEIHKALAVQHVQNRWYAMGPSEVLQVASSFFDWPQRLQVAEAELDNVAASPREPKQEAGLAAQAKERVASQVHAAAPSTTQETPQLSKTGEAIKQRDQSNESDEGKLVAQPAEENASAILVPCAKCDAGTARSISEALQKKLGKDASAALLKHYKQAVMRDSEGKNRRYWVNAAGATVQLAGGADSAAAAGWKPNLTLEQAYDDLSDASSLDGHESPAHKQIKEYAQARRTARTMAADAPESEDPFTSPRNPGTQ
jgi:hypothetical protein